MSSRRLVTQAPLENAVVLMGVIRNTRNNIVTIALPKNLNVFEQHTKQLRELDTMIDEAVFNDGHHTTTYKRHQNPDGSRGGFVNDCSVDKSVSIAPTAVVRGGKLKGKLQVLENSTVLIIGPAYLAIEGQTISGNVEFREFL